MTLRLGNKKVCPTKIVKVNNVDFSKLNYQNYMNANSSGKPLLVNGYYTRFDSALIVSSGGVEYSANSGVVNFSQPFEINCEFIAPTTAGGAIFGNCNNNQYFRCPSAEFQANGTTTIWTAVSTDGTTWTNQFSFTTSEVPTVLGGRYIINHKYDGSNYTVSVTYNGNTVTKTQTLSTPPYFMSGSSASSSYFGFGGTANNYNLQFKDGKIWIGNTYIKQNGVLTWGCEKGQDYIEVDPNNYLISNVTKVGDIEDNKGVLSGFVNSGTYAYTPTITLTEGSEVNISFIVPTSMSSDAPIISGWNSNYKGDVFIGGSNNKIWIWDNSSALGGNTVMAANNQYSFKLIKNSSNLLDMYLKEGLPTSDISDYTLEFSNATDIISGNQIRLGIFNSQWFLYGFIDLNNCYIKGNGQTVWQGVVPQGTRG